MKIANFSTDYQDILGGGAATANYSAASNTYYAVASNTIASLGSNTLYAGIEVVIDGGGAVITPGVKGDLEVPFAATIVGSRLFADQTGSFVLDIYRDTYGNYPPTDADSITGSAKPTLSSQQKAEDVTLSGWTTSLNEGDVLRFYAVSADVVTRVTCALRVRRR